MLVVTSPPFEITESGWGEFVIHIKISLKSSRFKPLSLSHQLHLHHPLSDIPKHDAPVISQVFDEIILYASILEPSDSQINYQPFTDAEALKELENLDKVIAHFENLLGNNVS